MEKEKQLRDLLRRDKVVVFQREVLRPWDGIPRFDFLDCNLKTVFREGDEYKSNKTVTKDPFIGNINLMKHSPAKKKQKKNVSSFEQ